MGESTAIQWTDHTFNPWIGCTKVAPGCANCYAEADMDKRRGRAKWGPNGTRSITSVENWKKPFAWNREAEQSGVRRRVFCASLADVFEAWGDGAIHQGDGVLLKPPSEAENIRSNWIVEYNEDWRKYSQGWRQVTLHDLRRELFQLIDSTPWLDWQLLTKRPENVGRMWRTWSNRLTTGQTPTPIEGYGKFRANVWLGTSVGDQQTADKAIPELLKCRHLSPVLFLSAEPLLGSVSFRWAQWHDISREPGAVTDQQDGLRRLDWVIVGGESGPNARRCRPEWIRRIASECQTAGVPCFVKQMGANVVTRNDMIEDAFNSNATGWPDPQVEYDINGYREEYQGADCRIHLRCKKGGDLAEWPADLRIRQFPEVA